MKKKLSYLIVSGALLAAGPQLVMSGEHQHDHPHTTTMSKETSVLVNITASVEAVDAAKREVTLKGPLGNKVTFTVDQRVKRFDEIKVGDYVSADYYISLAAEERTPPAEDANPPITALEGAANAPPGTSPAAGGWRRFKVVTTVEGLDRPTQTITVKGPLGNYLTARVEDPARLTQLHIGETIVITYTEALAISLEKVAKKTAE